MNSNLKIVKCLDTQGYDNLTVGRNYEVIYEDENRYGVITDYEETNYLFDKSMFRENDKVCIEIRALEDVNETLTGEIRKLYAEVGEFSIAALKKDYSNIIEEYHDVIQVMTNICDMLDIPNVELAAGVVFHIAKLENRGWKFKDK